MAKEDNTNIEKINFVINDGDSFYSNEVSITFGPSQFSLDFKNITPRVDARSEEGTKTFALKHNVIILDPYQAKNFIKILNDSIARFEKNFGTIDAPKSLKMAEKKIKMDKNKKQPASVSQIPSYLG